MHVGDRVHQTFPDGTWGLGTVKALKPGEFMVKHDKPRPRFSVDKYNKPTAEVVGYSESGWYSDDDDKVRLATPAELAAPKAKAS